MTIAATVCEPAADALPPDCFAPPPATASGTGSPAPLGDADGDADGDVVGGSGRSDGLLATLGATTVPGSTS